MTIRAGEEWGEVVPCPDGLARVDGDAALHRLVGECRASGQAVPAVGLLGGDLFRAVGGVQGVDRLQPGADVARLPVDLVRVVLDGERTLWSVVHVVAHAAPLGAWGLGWWRGGAVALMTGQFLGSWDVAPRCHPNDGRVDVVTLAPEMSLRERLAARRRLPLGSHVPHPAIATRQARAGSLDLPPRSRVRVDGVDAGRASRLEWTVEPDAYVVHV